MFFENYGQVVVVKKGNKTREVSTQTMLSGSHPSIRTDELIEMFRHSLSLERALAETIRSSRTPDRGDVERQRDDSV